MDKLESNKKRRKDKSTRFLRKSETIPPASEPIIANVVFEAALGFEVDLVSLHEQQQEYFPYEMKMDHTGFMRIHTEIWGTWAISPRGMILLTGTCDTDPRPVWTAFQAHLLPLLKQHAIS